MNNVVAYCIAFAKSPAHTVYREQAKIMLESLIRFGKWNGEIVVFTNLNDRPLVEEMPESYRDRIAEIILPFDDFGSGKDGKLPSARFRIHAWEHFDQWNGASSVLYIDTDCIVRRPLGPAISWFVDSHAWIAGATVANRSMASSKWFMGHIHPEDDADARKTPPVQSGTVLFWGGHRFQQVCELWAQIDALPPRPGIHPHLVTDQSSHNLLHLRATQKQIPIKSERLPVSAVSCPHQGQRNTLGHAAINESAIWHYWHLKDQEDRVVAMRSEFDRLERIEHPAPMGLIGRWQHDKHSENIRNIWEFHPDGLITVDHPAICGRWEWRPAESALAQSEILIDWLWGWEKIHLGYVNSAPIPPRLVGESFRNGAFTLERL